MTCEPPGEPWVPAVVLKIGSAVVTDRIACWLSSVTARGVERTLASASVLRKESTALTPSAFRKKVDGLKPSCVFAVIIGAAGFPGDRMPLSSPGVARV